MSSLTPTVLALCMYSTTAQLGEPPAVAAADKDNEVEIREVAVEVDVAPLREKESSDLAELFVTEDVAAALQERHGLRVVSATDVPVVFVRLSWSIYMESIYRVEIGFRRPGEETTIIQDFERHFPHEEKLAAVIADSIGPVVEKLKSGPEPAAEEPKDTPAEHVDEPTPPEPKTDPASPEEPTNERRPLGPAGKAGIGLMAAGVAGAVGGGVLFAQGTKVDTSEQVPYVNSGTDYRPAGLAVLVTGGAVLLTGAALLIVDRVRARPKRSGQRPRASLAPAGLAIQF